MPREPRFRAASISAMHPRPAAESAASRTRPVHSQPRGDGAQSGVNLLCAGVQRQPSGDIPLDRADRDGRPRDSSRRLCHWSVCVRTGIQFDDFVAAQHDQFREPGPRGRIGCQTAMRNRLRTRIIRRAGQQRSGQSTGVCRPAAAATRSAARPPPARGADATIAGRLTPSPPRVTKMSPTSTPARCGRAVLSHAHDHKTA